MRRLRDVPLVADERDPQPLPQEPTEPPGHQVGDGAGRLVLLLVAEILNDTEICRKSVKEIF